MDDITWRARDDMRVLSQAQEIMSDSRRHSAAKKQAVVEMKKMEKVVSKK